MDSVAIAAIITMGVIPIGNMILCLIISLLNK